MRQLAKHENRVSGRQLSNVLLGLTDFLLVGILSVYVSQHSEISVMWAAGG